MRRRLVQLVFSAMLLALACRSGSHLVDHGYAFESVSTDRFVVKFEGDSGMSEDEVRDNLLFHAARHTLDLGALYFVIENVRIEKSNVTKKQTTETEGAPVGREPASSGSTGPSYSESYSFSRQFRASGTVTIYREKPSDPAAREASRLISELSRR